MGIYNYDRLRMGNLLPTQTGSGYRNFDQFLASVLPLLNQSRAGNRAYDRRLIEDEQRFKTAEREGAQEAAYNQLRLKEIGDMQKLDAAQRAQQGNVVIDRSQEITPYQQAQLGLQAKGIDVTDRRAEIAAKAQETAAKTAEERLELEDRRLTETERKNKAQEELAQARNTLLDYKAKNPDVTFDYSGTTVMMNDPKNKRVVDTGVPTRHLSDEAKANLNFKHDTALQTQKTEESPGTPMMMEDPDNPGKMIPVMFNPRTKKAERVTLDGRPIQGPVTKIGTPSSSKLNQPVNLDAIRTQTQQVLDVINNQIVTTNKEGVRELSPIAKSAVGWRGLDPRQFLPESEQRSGKNIIKKFKAQQVVNLIGEMKAQSRTGATGFGQLNLRELGVLENAAYNLDNLDDPILFLEEVERIRVGLEKVMKDAEEKAAGGAQPPLSSVPGAKTGGISATDSMKKAQETINRLRGVSPR